MASNVQNTGDILSSIIDLRTELATLSKSFQPGTARVPLGLGYPWEASAALADNVLLLDAIGRKVLLPMMLLSSPEVSNFQYLDPFSLYPNMSTGPSRYFGRHVSRYSWKKKNIEERVHDH
jgi:hypothetical protein